ncbi:JmjC domain-containing protein 4 [Merluccius polli]|uniref:Jumonji domain-containing protein 4 n=1 Tax=Merluccius polli TaxID=89951 RepID=A0AA47MVN4_MERPO|nr:JmjC domain-containing protein 4 [Merluccius polli]
MDRESYHNCCSLVKIPRQSYDRFWSSHFVEYIDKEISYSTFFKKYLLPNHPCMFSRRFTEDWRCLKQWVTAEGKPNFQTLLQEFDETPVPVANCNAKEYNANPKQTMPFKEFIHYWKEYIQNGNSSPKGCLYLKDWHMARTPFHADVFRSYSWSANICGRKKWLLYPPGQEEFLKDTHGNLAYDVTAADLRDKDLFPQSDKACQPLEIIQEAGEIIFVPSGWHHQVYNLEDTISINHNWLNGCNIDIMWQFLQNELSAVQREIEEWRTTMDSWHQHCQTIMKSCSGIDYGEFASFLKIIAENRIAFLSACSSANTDYPRHLSETLAALGSYHAAFDLQRVVHILECLICSDDFKRLDHTTLNLQPESLLQKIRETIHSTRGQHLP